MPANKSPYVDFHASVRPCRLRYINITQAHMQTRRIVLDRSHVSIKPPLTDSTKRGHNPVLLLYVSQSQALHEVEIWLWHETCHKTEDVLLCCCRKHAKATAVAPQRKVASHAVTSPNVSEGHDYLSISRVFLYVYVYAHTHSKLKSIYCLLKIVIVESVYEKITGVSTDCVPELKRRKKKANGRWITVI